ncbi:bromodomain-containing protein 8-like isoform X1 [Pieris napi]|uniref:bromodomain-containing protein 8-like isoform X1 n=1 Tax=Pieris napi TaxID=78633 RepID=UPI001FBAA792|nr:bromodomain-containing protein 8-like isoform X1 [Pieris napi]
MTSIQERLQLKRAPLDTWNIREQLCLASAVVRSGDQNWMSVSRALKSLADPNRPQDWYSQKNCAVQYGALLEHVETPKRKKRNSEGGVETPQESILKRLRDQRVQEIKNSLAEINAEYEQIKNEVNEVRNSSTSEEKLQELWAEIEASKQKRERENATRAAWMKEREERILKAEKTWRPQTTVATTTQVTSATPSSPLLSSLLKSTPVVTTPQHILHPNNCIETVSPSAGAPTLSLLLEQPQDKEHAAIEHIKSQLVQIEHQLKASTSGSPVPNPPSIVTTAVTPAVDIDDIEIKAEDVYAFSDIDIHIPPVAAMHKPRVEKQYKKEEEPCVIEEPMQEDKVEEVPVSEPIVEPSNTTEDVQVELIKTEVIQEEETIPETEIVPEVKIAFPEVKFPTPEIKVIQSDDTQLQPKVEQEPLEASLPLEEEVKQEKTEIEGPVEEPIVEEIQDVPEKEVIEEKVDEPEPAPLKEDIPQEDAQPEPEAAEVETNIPTEEIPLPESPKPEEPVIEETAPEAQPEPEADTEVNVQIQDIPLPETEETKEEMEEVRETKEEKKEEDEDSIPLKDMIKEEIVQEKDKEEEAHTETDDDTPMELSREEDKEGKTKRDYSRKKKPDSRTCSGSESAPDSPSSSEAERQHRLWKKSVMLVYSRLCAHKYASLFLRPITDEEAPGYSTIVKRPMDLSTIRRNIDAGHIRTTAQFQRDVLLMLSNALMYNSTSHSVYAMAKDMFEEAQCQLGMLLAAQAHAGLVNTAPPTRKRRPQTNPNSPSQFKTQRL